MLKRFGYELYDVEFVKEVDWFLRVYIDSENGIDLDDCEKVSNAISDMLDEKDPISTSYSLEVSSCGLERHLREIKHYEAALGKKVEVKLYKAVNGQKQIEGEVTKVNGEEITLRYDENEEVSLNLTDISSAKILFNWEE